MIQLNLVKPNINKIIKFKNTLCILFLVIVVIIDLLPNPTGLLQVRCKLKKFDSSWEFVLRVEGMCFGFDLNFYWG